MKIKELHLLSLATMIFGVGVFIVSIFLPSSAFSLLSPTISAEQLSSSSILPLLQAFSGIIGVLIILLGVFLHVMAYNYRPEYWNYLLVGFTMWFTVDTVVSIFYAYGYNGILNSVIYSVILVILFRIRRKYHQIVDTDVA